MITNFNKKNRKDDIKILGIIVFAFFFVIWLCTPPGNKIAQLCFYGNNTQFFIAKLTKPQNELNEWVFYRNNAIYLAQMEQKEASLREMNKAVQAMPSYVADIEVSRLYSERAQLRMYFGEYKLALDDFLRVKDPTIIDRFKIALLYKNVGNNKFALSYCNSILNTDPSAYIGYACMADVYAGVGRYNTSVKVYDLLIDRIHNRARFYADRAFYKKKCGDTSGYNQDMKKAKELSPLIEEEISIIKETLRPKKLTLEIV